MKPLIASLAVVAGLLAIPAESAGQGSSPQAPASAQPQQSATTPAPATATLTLHVAAGLRYARGVYVVAGQPLLVEGTLRPFAPGQTVTVQLRRGRRLVAQSAAHVHQGSSSGIFRVMLRPRRPGNYRVAATHRADSAQAAATSRAASFGALEARAGPGSGGVAVRLLQRSLARLGYITSEGGRYDATTALGVLAFRKVNRMSRTDSADERVFSELFRGRGGFRLRYPHARRHAEFDFARQVLVLADHGRAQRIYPASSGKPSTPTVFGSFRFYRKQPGTNSHGMFDSSYFIAGYAVHGYPDVPTYPASHGCIRVPMSEAVAIYGALALGERIMVYP